MHLPGLLGMDSLEKNRAIIDAGKGRLIYPGPGEAQIILPPGSIEMPIVKSPSGHPCIVVDEYAKLITTKAGGANEPIPTLTATQPTAEPAKTNEVLQASAHPAKPQHERPRHLRVLVVGEQPVASALFT